ncbi:MAG: hypothetical protein EP329_13520, partial [Deltaproteobacteria bacterium]
MSLVTLLQRQRAGAPAREQVEEVTRRELADTPDRRYDAVVAGLKRAARQHAEATGTSRFDGESGGSAPSAPAPTTPAPSTPAPAAPTDLPIVATITANKVVTNDASPSAFGVMNPTFSFPTISSRVEDNKVVIEATLNCAYSWGVNALGRTDVPSGSASFITAANYKSIADDLDPDLGTHTNEARYANYWSKKATEDHELEHVRDDWEDFVNVSGITLAKTTWEGKTVKSDQVSAGLDKLKSRVSRAIMAGSDAHYMGGASNYYARAGEVKAFAVGAAVERPLAAAIRTHGKALEEKEEHTSDPQ